MAKDGPATTAAGPGGDEAPRKQHYKLNREINPAMTAAVPPDATVKRFEDNNATIAAFISGQVDLIATGNTVAAAIAEKVPARAPTLKFVIKDSPCYLGLNKDEPKLLAKVNEIITKAKASGEIAKLSEKWLKAPLPPGF